MPLLILRAKKLLEEGGDVNQAVIVAVTLFVGYRLAALAAGAIGGRAIDAAGPGLALALGSTGLLGAYILAETGGAIAVMPSPSCSPAPGSDSPRQANTWPWPSSRRRTHGPWPSAP